MIKMEQTDQEFENISLDDQEQIEEIVRDQSIPDHISHDQEFKYPKINNSGKNFIRGSLSNLIDRFGLGTNRKVIDRFDNVSDTICQLAALENTASKTSISTEKYFSEAANIFSNMCSKLLFTSKKPAYIEQDIENPTI